ncbi:hypothetical protein [Streptomyces noursei]|uniref:hypothetical protein n=1 Tax=Streptomyces noursei TaxID=1971 RepID=UPI00045EF866|nr:hypothetical protein [Streptomyces noursei]AIA06622.1 hypothetical protein DC74_6181 [Streptomyces noursei]
MYVRTGSRPRLVISTGGRGAVSHAGARLVVSPADAGEAIADLALLLDQPEVFEAWPPTRPLLADIGPATFGALRAARAGGR